MMTTFHSHTLCNLFTLAVLLFLINLNEKQCNKSTISIDHNHKLVLEYSSAAAVNILPDTVNYLKAIKCFNI